MMHLSSSRLPFMHVLRYGFLLLLLMAAARCRGAERYFDISDRADTDVDSVRVAQGSAGWILPLDEMACKAGWSYQRSGERATVVAAGWTVTLRAGNVFARAGNRFVQLGLPPELREETLWVQVSDLEVLFGDKLEVRAAAHDILVMSLAPAPVPAALSSETEPRWSLKTVIIDPGHGGKDPGALGRGGVEEKTITLDIARQLAAALEDSGLQVELTRTSDEFVSLQQRTRRANAQRGDLFLSIHCNSHRDSRIHGIETYFLSPARTERAVDAALKENSVVDLEEDASGYQDLAEAGFILQAMATSQNLKDSETWAASVAHQAAAATGLESRGVDQAGFYVLMGASMPALLVECGYLSHAGDSAYLTTERGRQRLAEALAASILSMKQKLETSSSR